MKKLITLLILTLLLSACTRFDAYQASEDEVKQPSNVVVWDLKLNDSYDDIDNWFTTRRQSGGYINGAGATPENEYLFSLTYNREDFYNSDNQYKFVADSYNSGGLMVYKNGRVGIIDEKGNRIFDTNLTFNTYSVIKYKNLDSSASLKEFLLTSDYHNNPNSEFINVTGGTSGGSTALYTKDEGLICLEEFSNNQQGYIDLYKLACEKEVIESGDKILVNTFASSIDYSAFRPNDSKLKDAIIGYLIVDDKDYKQLDVPMNYVVEDYSNDVITFIECEQLPYTALKNKNNTSQNYYAYESCCGGYSYGKVHYYNLEGKEIGSGFDDGYGFYEEYAPVCKDGMWGYIDKNGNLVVGYIFDKALPIAEGKSWVMYKGETGRLNIIDMLNNQIEFNDINLTSNIVELNQQ